MEIKREVNFEELHLMLRAKLNKTPARRDELATLFKTVGATKLDEVKVSDYPKIFNLMYTWNIQDVYGTACKVAFPDENEEPENPFIQETVRKTIRVGNYGHLSLIKHDPEMISITLQKDSYTSTQLRELAKQLTDLADAHDQVYGGSEQ